MIRLTPDAVPTQPAGRPTPSGGSHGAGFMAVMEKMSAASQATIRVAPIPVDEDTAESEPGTAAANSDDRISNESRDDVANGDTHHQDTDDEFLFDLDAKDAFTVDGDDLSKTSLRLVSDATRDPVDIFGPEAVKPTDRLPSSERSPRVLFEPDDRRPTPEGRGPIRHATVDAAKQPVSAAVPDREQRTSGAMSLEGPNRYGPVDAQPEPLSNAGPETAAGFANEPNGPAVALSADIDREAAGDTGTTPVSMVEDTVPAAGLVDRQSLGVPNRPRNGPDRYPEAAIRTAAAGSEPPDNAARPSDTSLRNGAAEHRIFPVTASLNPAASPFVRQGGDAVRHMADTWLAPATSEMAEPHRATAAAVWGERSGQRLQFEAPLAGGILSGLSIRHKDGTSSEPFDAPPQTHLPATFSPPAGLAQSNGALSVAASEASLHLATGSGTSDPGTIRSATAASPPETRDYGTTGAAAIATAPPTETLAGNSTVPGPASVAGFVGSDVSEFLASPTRDEFLRIAHPGAAEAAHSRPSPVGPHAALSQQIAQAAEAVRFRGGGSTEITLSPEELGSVRMTLSRTETGYQIAILVERDDTLALLRRHADLLEGSFRDLDLGDTDISFSSGRQDGGEPNGSGSLSPRDAESFPDPDADSVRSSNDGAMLSGRLNLKL